VEAKLFANVMMKRRLHYSSSRFLWLFFHSAAAAAPFSDIFHIDHKGSTS